TRSKRDWSSDVCSSDLNKASSAIRTHVACNSVEFCNSIVGDRGLWNVMRSNKGRMIWTHVLHPSIKFFVKHDEGCIYIVENVSRSEERRVGIECRERRT